MGVSIYIFVLKFNNYIIRLSTNKSFLNFQTTAAVTYVIIFMLQKFRQGVHASFQCLVCRLHFTAEPRHN